MRTNVRSLVTFLLTSLVAFSFFFTAQAKDMSALTIGTGSITGLYYPIGKAICSVLRQSTPPLSCLALQSPGSLSNIDALVRHEQDLGFAQMDLLAAAYTGQPPFTAEQAANYRANVLLLLSPFAETVTVIVRQNDTINRIEDLRGHIINIGPKGSGNYYTAARLLAALGIEEHELKGITEFKPTDQAEALCNGTIDVMIFVAGHPNPTVQNAMRQCPTKIIPVNGSAVEALLTSSTYYTRQTIPVGLYPGVTMPISTYGVKAALVATPLLPEETGYTILKTLNDSNERFRTMHPALENLKTSDLLLHDDKIALHKGALRFMKERTPAQ